MPVRLALDEDQRLLGQGLRQLLGRLCPPAAVRAAWTDGPSRARWRELEAAGLSSLLVDATEVEFVVALEEVGRVALPEPILEAAVAAPLLARPAIVGIGLRGAPLVVDADVFVMEDAAGLHALERAAVTVEPVRSVDGARRLVRVGWRVEDGVALGPAGELPDRAALGAAAQLLGLGRRMLEMTVDYVKVRQQFGRPVGSFQAVKHHLADAHVRLELAGPAVLRAAAAMARREPGRAARVSMAKALASDAAALVARKALQCHGAIGYAFDSDLHLWMKRAWALASSWGDAAWHRSRLGAAVLDGGLDFDLGG
jgi:alkylation response protein AidB-like acyl-CoA dehydrogenase